MMPDLVISLGEGASIRPLSPEDVTEAYADGLNDPEVNRFLMGPRGRLQTVETVRNFVADNAEATDAILFGLFIDGRLVGTSRLSQIDGATASQGVALFDRSCWGKGHATRLIHAVAEYALNILGLDIVTAGTDIRNVGSRKAFERAGFIPSSEQNGVVTWSYAARRA